MSPTTPDTEAVGEPGIQASELATQALKWDLWLGLLFRLMIAGIALAAGALAVIYTFDRADQMVAILRAPRADGDLIGDRLLALSVPVVLLVLLAVVAVSVAFAAHKRGLDETWRTLDAINRIRRENEVAVSARGLTHAFEEKIDNATRAFKVMIWLGRTLFVVCLGLFSIAVVNAVASGVDVLTVTLGAMSLGGALLGIVQDVPTTLTRHLANVVQIQTIVTGCDRQISLLESQAFSVLNRKTLDQDVVNATVLNTQEHLDAVVERAVVRIQDYADPTGEKGRRAKSRRHRTGESRVPWRRSAAIGKAARDGAPAAPGAA